MVKCLAEARRDALSLCEMFFADQPILSDLLAELPFLNARNVAVFRSGFWLNANLHPM
jgi:hypothetical protein